MAAKFFVGLVVATAMAGFVVSDEATSDETEEYSAQLKDAQQLIEAGQLAEGIKSLHSLAARARDPEVFMELGDALSSLGETDMAIGAYSRVVVAPGGTQRPDLISTAYFKRGQLHLATDRIREAFSDFTQGVELNPVNSKLQYGRGRASLELSKLATPESSRRQFIGQAIKSFDSAIRFDEEYALAYYERGMAKAMLGQESDAQHDLRQALALDRDGELNQRLAELTVELQTENESLRSKLSKLEEEAEAKEEQTREEVQGINKIAETLLEIRDLLRVQTARR